MLTNEQHETRRLRIGSSEIGALLGVDPHKTALDVFAEKTLGREIETDADHRTWGLDLEPAILLNHARRNGLRLLPPVGTLIAPALPALCCTPDALATPLNADPTLILPPVRDVQAKNCQWMNSGGWGEPGTDDAPLLYVAQVTVELGILRAIGAWDLDDTADLVVSIGGAPPVAYRIPFDADLFGTLNDLAVKFVRDHLQTGKEPEGWERDGSAMDYVRRRFPDHGGSMLEPTDETRGLASALAECRVAIKEWEARKKTAQATLCKLIGEAAGIDGVATWKKCKDAIGKVTAHDEIAIELALRLKLSAAEMNALLAEHTRTVVTRKGSRRLRLLNDTNGEE